MSEFPDLDRLLEEATFFPSLGVRLAALRQVLSITETHLQLARRLAIEQVRREHRERAELHPEDREYDLNELEQRVTHHLPQLFRGGSVMLVWSIFERTTKDIAGRACEYVGSPLPSKHFRAGGLFERLETAISKSTGLATFADEGIKKQLTLFRDVRTVLIHHDGRLQEASSQIRSLSPVDRELVGLRVERDYDFEYIVPEAEFIHAIVKTVDVFVSDLASRVFLHLVPASGDA